jgi:hypothetical protein
VSRREGHEDHEEEDGGMAEFEDYVRILCIPQDAWKLARVVVDASTGVEIGPKYRLRSALDYYLHSSTVKNHYLRFILMVIVMERLFSFDKKREYKQDQLANAISAYLPSVARSELKKDYRIRNNLVHGPKASIHRADEIKSLADKWSSWCQKVLRDILVDDRNDKIPTDS